MKPRDRVLAAFKGEEVFPVPFDVYKNGFYPKLRAGLLQHFGLPEDDYDGLLLALGACFRFGTPLYIGPLLEEDPSGVPSYPCRKVARNIWGTWDGPETYYDGFDRPLRSAETIVDIDSHAWPSPDWYAYDRAGSLWDTAETYLPVAEWATRNSDFARHGAGWNPVFSRVMDLFGMETGLRHLADRPDLIHVTVAHIGDFLVEFYRRFACAGRGHYDVLGFGDDFASQGGMLVAPSKWREYFLPLWKSLFAIAHENGMKAGLHSCGSVRPVLGDLIDAGLDVLEVVQVTAVGMGPAELKREFGRHLAFYGGMDTQHILPQGSPADVRREVRRLIDILGKDGRFILASVHFLMDDVPVENVLAMYDEARTYRG